uniref:Uncharacterized protein n=1 Tax=Timema bartmani TaxID=61472 RepID=A0A7R9F2H2_9NEOP|nr:unnamed protein product [Timema bartmani]
MQIMFPRRLTRWANKSRAAFSRLANFDECGATLSIGAVSHYCCDASSDGAGVFEADIKDEVSQEPSEGESIVIIMHTTNGEHARQDIKSNTLHVEMRPWSHQITRHYPRKYEGILRKLRLTDEGLIVQTTWHPLSLNISTIIANSGGRSRGGVGEGRTDDERYHVVGEHVTRQDWNSRE